MWLLEQLHVGICELQTNNKQIQVPEERSVEKPKGGGDKQGPSEARVPPRGARHRLLVHAGGRDEHRPSRRLLQIWGVCEPCREAMEACLINYLFPLFI